MITIRPAQLTDRNELVLLCPELGYRTSAATLSQQLAQFQTHAEHAVFVAETTSAEGSAEGEQQAMRSSSPDRLIVGWVHVHLHTTLQEGREAAIGGLVVSPALRGQGVGKQLMQQAEAWAQQQGCCAVIVSSNLQRRDAHQFYQRVGYQEIKRSIVFRQPLSLAEPGSDTQF